MRRQRFVVVSFVVALACAVAWAGDWPMYRHDVARSAVTSDEARPPLVPCWVYQPLHGPEPAWGDPKPVAVEGILERRRMHFDDVFQVAVAGGTVTFGSSADNNVYALDAATGKERWRFITGGPVRLAPTVANGKVYFGSDDGFAYCLRASDGTEVWRFRAAPNDKKLLGHGKMISLWPLRTGVLVDGGVAYLTAGIFPAEGVYAYAVGAEDGKLLWCNDTCGAAPQSRISPQGYLLASRSALFAPMARVSPASFDRKTGRLLQQTYFGKNIGGTYALLADGQVFTGTEEMIAYDQKSRAQFAWFGGRQLIVTPDAAYMVTDKEMVALDRTTYPKASLRRRSVINRRQRLGSPRHIARRDQRRLGNAIKQHNATLKSIDNQIAALANQGDAAAKDGVALKTERAKVAKQLEADATALEAAKQRAADLKNSSDAMVVEQKQADADMAKSIKWRCASTCSEALILAGGTLFAGGQGRVAAIDAATGKEQWAGKVAGKAKGLAVADGRLLVSTDTGAIHCFGPAGSKPLGVVRQAANPSPYPRDALAPVIEAAADHIVRATGITKGHCLVVGNNTGRLAYELAKRTELRIHCVCPSAERVAAARKALDAAGLLGARVCVEQVDPARIPYSDYFADLIVSEGTLVKGKLPFDAKDVYRMLKPLGGTICIGQPAAAKGKTAPLAADALRRWLQGAGVEGAQVAEQNGVWLKFTRGPLPGAGSWTHQYAEPGNTTCSDDQLVRCPLRLLWFGDPGPGDMVNRHSRPAAPLSINGKLFVQGENVVMAYDAYNGRKLWKRKIPGAMRVVVSSEASNFVANADSLFVAVGSTCLRLDQATGKTTMTYKLPPAPDGKKRRWGYLACVGDLLYASMSARGTYCDVILALDAATGAVRWRYAGKTIAHSSLAIGAGRLYFVDFAVSAEQRQAALKEQIAAAARLKGLERIEADKKVKAAVVRLVGALDARTGETLWQEPLDLTDCGGGAYYSALGAIYSNDVLMLFGVYSDGHYWRDFFAGQFEFRRVAALSAKDGRQLWTKRIGYRVRPLVIGDEFHAEPWAFDLKTGRQKKRIHPVTGQEVVWQFARPGHHCGCPAACPNVMLFRSYTLAWYDLVGDFGIQHFGAQRPSCWINFIPASGLLLIPEGGVGCMCPFPNLCTVVFKQGKETRQWAYYSSPGPMTPVKHLALNFGAPGDRRDKAGALWFGYPRPGGSLVLRFKVDTAMHSGGTHFRHDPERISVAGTDKPWVFRSGILGLRQCVIPLVGSGDGAARYTVRLAFADLDQAKAGTRVFDIKLQGKVVATDFDIAKEAGGQRKAIIREFRGIDVKDKLVIELAPKVAKPTAEQLPLLQGVEVVREQVLSLGFSVPSFLLSDAEPEQSGEVRIANHKDAAFEGTLRVEAPDGFAVAPAASEIKLASGQKTVLTLEASVAKKGERGTYPVVVKLLRKDGTVEWEQRSEIDYLANRGRIVVKAAEDAYVGKSFPNVNRGTTGTLNVDGGHARMGDDSHHIAYLKFRLSVPGKPVSATLKLYNAGNPTGDSGNVCLVAEPWSETKITYDTRPKPGKVLAKIGRVAEHQVVVLPLKLSLEGKAELSVVIEPTSCDGVNYIAREGGKPAELVVEYEQ